MPKGEGIKILPQSPQKCCRDCQYCLLAQVQAGNTSENLRNEIRQIVYSFKKKLFLKRVTCSINIRISTIFISSENSKTFDDPYRLRLNLLDKMDLRRVFNHVVLSGLSIYYILKNIKKSYKDIKFKITQNEEFELSGGSHSMSGIHDYFEYVIKKHETYNRTYFNKI